MVQPTRFLDPSMRARDALSFTAHHRKDAVTITQPCPFRHNDGAALIIAPAQQGALGKMRTLQTNEGV